MAVREPGGLVSMPGWPRIEAGSKPLEEARAPEKCSGIGMLPPAAHLAPCVQGFP